MPEIMICVPIDVTGVEKRAVLEAAISAGAKKAYLIEEARAAALGSGMDIAVPEGNMIIDIGGGSTDVAIISLGGTVVSKTIRIAGKNPKDFENKAYQLFEELNVMDRRHHKPKNLSGGEAQRVAVIRALIHSPKIIFADEPTGNLDSKNADSLHQLFFDLRDKYNQTFVIITHNPILADSTDRKLVMKDGIIL